ncbi:SRPBCC family protein [Streptomyces sparsogenes]|uniref:Cyclase/dehydrase n=1 Tax=Streptomyces sparsogenes DSM 40356 TaxID=1331668 RepID=A0A1R1S912_9ACTN|nr:SRPBCC family protein [Streptomyces sparsogenes]OMI34851.1 cyclase/dehydrase [Streptomyces sparsogenes DSM 40356]
MAERSDGDRREGGLGTLTKELPTERLKKEAQGLLMALGQRALSTVGNLGDGGGPGLKMPVKPLLKMGAKKVAEKAKDKAKDVIPGLGGGGGGGRGKKLKVTNIVEQIDVGVPVSVAYNQWTQFEDFPSFMKKVENVDQTSDTENDWKAQIFLSHREWHAEIIDQVPDQHIVWRSRGQKGHVDGAVTFHEIAPNLTRILVVLQYHPQGFFEHTGNLWRAQGRRARLELKHFRRHVMSEVLLNPDEVQGWRGEIRDGEVTRTPDEEGEGDRERKGGKAEEAEEDEENEEPRGEDEEEDEYEDEYDDEQEERGGRGGEDEYADEADEEDQYEEEDEDEEPRRRSRR